MDEINKKIKDLLEMTKKEIMNNNFDKAIKILETILILEPNHDEASYILGKINSKLHKTVSETDNSIEIFGYNEVYAVNPAVKIFFNGTEIGQVQKAGYFNFQPESDGLLTFKCYFRNTKVNIQKGENLKIQLSWNRTWGNLIATKI